MDSSGCRVSQREACRRRAVGSRQPCKTSPLPVQTRKQLEDLETQLAAKDTQLNDLLAGKQVLDAELAALRLEIAEAKKQAAAQPDTHDYSEAETRDAFIDLLLKEAGWPLDRGARPRVRGRRHAQQQGQGLCRLRAVGRRRQAAGAGGGQAHASAIRAWASSRPSCTPIAWRRSSASAR